MTSRAYPSDDPGSADCGETVLKCNDGLPRQQHTIQTIKAAESQQKIKKIIIISKKEKRISSCTIKYPII